MNATRVLVVDDHGLVRAGICALLNGLAGITVVGEAADGRAALCVAGEVHPDVMLVNISMPELNGLETTARVAREHPRTRVVVCSSHPDEDYVRRAFAMGAAGYLLKGADRAELELAVRAVARGEVWLSPSVSRAAVAALVRGEPAPGPFELLTSRQREVLQLVAEGHSSKEIATRLGLGTRTVEAHRAQLARRLGVKGTPGLVRAAIELGIVSPTPPR